MGLQAFAMGQHAGDLAQGCWCPVPQGFEAVPYHVGYPANLGKAPQVIGVGLIGGQRLSQAIARSWCAIDFTS